MTNSYIGHIIGHCDHFSIPCRDPEASVSFYETIMGAEIYEDEHGPHVFGISPEDKALGRPIHIFLKLPCGQRLELLSYDLKGVQPAGTHHGFRVGPNDLEAVMRHLDEHGIPFWGPGKHRGTNAVSVYWKDPDGNQFEFVVLGGYQKWDEVPLSQHMAKPPISYEWDPVARRGRAKPVEIAAAS